MKILFSNSNNPHFNLACEEYFFKNLDEDLIFIYSNENSVIIGKHQIPYKETDFKFVKTNDIKLCRRFSGGGTVFHDKGNLNFAFILKNKNKEINVDFKRFTEPIISFLKTLSLNAYTNSRNSILIDEKKISGNAEHINTKKVLHHGTLLFNSNLDFLRASIKNETSRFIDKSVSSVSSKVCNISDFLSKDIDFERFTKLFYDFIKNKYNCQTYEFLDSDVQNINKLLVEKYKTDYWNFMYSPSYIINGEFDYDNKSYIFSIKVARGIVQDFDFYPYNSEIDNNLKLRILGLPHLFEEFEESIKLYFNSKEEKRNFIFKLF